MGTFTEVRALTIGILRLRSASPHSAQDDIYKKYREQENTNGCAMLNWELGTENWELRTGDWGLVLTYLRENFSCFRSWIRGFGDWSAHDDVAGA